MAPAQQDILKDLGDGLILRRTTPADTEALLHFNKLVHRRDEEDPAEGLLAWVEDLMTKPHPTFKPEDFTIVEDTNSGAIVSSLNLIDQTWTYEGIEFGVGRPELVGTLPDYRRRGLIREQFDIIHGWSAERGHLVQGITGIPWYYRLFGYEMALDLDGGRNYMPIKPPKLEKDKEEPYLIRKAEIKDIDFLDRTYRASCKRSLVSCIRDHAMWEFDLTGRHPKSYPYDLTLIIETPEGEPAGYLIHAPEMWEPRFFILAYEVSDEASWLDVTPSVLRYLAAKGEEYTEAGNKDKAEDKLFKFESIYFCLNSDHPVYHILPDKMPKVQNPYAWYIRVPDLPGFIQHISPALEERLARSYFRGYSGELKLNFYTSGLKLVFEDGKLKASESLDHTGLEKPQANFPDLSFLQVLFGRRDLDEVEHAYADCYYSRGYPNEGAVLKVLFPKKPSLVWPIG